MQFFKDYEEVIHLLYPLKFEPIYKSIIWGGRNIEKRFDRALPEGKIAESWEISCRKEGVSVVSNGPLKGKTLLELMDIYKEELLGSSTYRKSPNWFPLLIKIIDANDKLSVQVHPDDAYARLNNEENGKTEMWYVIDAKPGAKLVYGLIEGTTREEFLKAVEQKNITSVLNMVPVKPGDSFYMPAGTVHAILDGILIAEIQQNSNTTYRVYDWDRVDSHGKGRELHLSKAIDVINFKFSNKLFAPPSPKNYGSYTRRKLSSNEFFTVEELIIDGPCNLSNPSGFDIIMTIDGTGTISYNGGSEPVKAGETVLMPASIGNYQLEGNLKTLRAYI